MKKQLLLICIALLNLINADAQDTASWNGAVSNDWNDAANWTWTNGNGVPDANDDVIINHGANYAHVTSNTIASCRNLKISEGINNYVSLYLDDSATLNVYGNITKGYDGSIITPGPLYKSTTLNLLGDGDQMLNQTQLTVGTINVDKASGNVYLPDEIRNVYIFNTINLKNAVAPIGTAPAGNIYLNYASILFDEENTQAKINIPIYQDNEIPPHLIMNTNAGAIYFLRDFTGYKLAPISNTATSYTPVTIHSTAESWLIKVWSSEEDNCDSISNFADAVKKTWLIMPTTHELGKQNSDNLARLFFTFHVDNDEDVPSNFNPGLHKLNIWRKKFMSACWNNIGSSPMTNGGYVTVQTPYTTQFYKFMLVPDTATPPVEVGINDIESTLSNITIYPNPTNDDVTLNLSLFTGNHLEITVSDLVGKVVYKNNLTNKNIPDTYKLDIQHFNKGLYFIRLSDDIFTETKKVLKN